MERDEEMDNSPLGIPDELKDMFDRASIYLSRAVSQLEAHPFTDMDITDEKRKEDVMKRILEITLLQHNAMTRRSHRLLAGMPDEFAVETIQNADVSLMLIERNCEFLFRRVDEIRMQLTGLRINFNCHLWLHYQPDSTSYLVKQQLIKNINDLLRTGDYALIDPYATNEGVDISSDESPKALYAIKTRDGKGAYTFEDRVTKKRAGYYRSLREVLPLYLTHDAPRKESFLTRRKKDE